MRMRVRMRARASDAHARAHAGAVVNAGAVADAARSRIFAGLHPIAAGSRIRDRSLHFVPPRRFSSCVHLRSFSRPRSA
jgi:hypothetical protein